MKLSIITVNLNNLEGLKKTYDSVVCQTFTNYEWIVIDGGSTDGSREFIEQHQDKFAYWCSEPDKGIYNAMNKGIVRAKGEYLNFMNSGDCFVKKETLAGVFGEERKVDILYGFVVDRHANGKCYMPCTMKQSISWYDIYSETFPHQGTFIKRSMFTIVGLYEENCKIVADWKWFVMALLNYGASYEFVPHKIAVIQPDGISCSMDCSLERQQQRKYLFPGYIANEDAISLTSLSIVQSNRLTCLLFKIIKVLAMQIRLVKMLFLLR